MNWKLKYDDGFVIENETGKNIPYDPNAGVAILEQDGFAFKDYNHSGRLEPYEDWRLSIRERIIDFLTQFSTSRKENSWYINQERVPDYILCTAEVSSVVQLAERIIHWMDDIRTGAVLDAWFSQVRKPLCQV